MANKAIGTLAVGSSVYLNVGGVRKEFLVAHQGLPSSMYDASCNGTWLLMKDIYENRVWQSENINKYESSDIHSYLNSTFLNLFDNNIRDAIKQVKLPYRMNGGSGGVDQSGANGLPCKVFLLSGYEVGWTNDDNSFFPVDGAKLAYFNSGTDTSANNKRIAHLNGSAAYWWLRSPSINSTNSVWRVLSAGDYRGLGAASSIGIRPALVLPSDALVDDSGNVLPPIDLTAHKTLINGTAYTVKGGKCMVNGTSYDIKKGRTLIGGTGYDITFKPQVHIYGVEWDWTSSGLTKGVRTDDAAGFNDPSPAVSNGTGSSPFDTLYPWSGMVKETRAGGVEVKEPKYWFKWTKTGKKLKLQIADGPVEGFFVDPVNRDRGDGLGELGHSYIGRYHCVNGYKSTTGAVPQGRITRSRARSGIHNLGANFWQMDFAQFWYVNMLFLVEFADWNGERIGRGCSTNGSKMNNGQTDAMGYHTGTTAASRDSYGFTQYRNIEGWWDNVYDWMDGCYYNSNGLNVISNPNNFSDSANGTLVGMPSSGYPSDFTIPTASGLEWALFPSAANGSQTTYVPDSWGFSGGNPCLRHGGNYVQAQDHGPFCVSYGGTSSSLGSVGCRLQERPPK